MLMGAQLLLPAHRSRRATSAFPSVVLLIGVSAALFGALPPAFLPSPPTKPSACGQHACKTSGSASRRGLLLATAGTVPALAPGLEPSFADKPPDSVVVSGFRKDYYDELNGRWSVVFGKKLNNKVVYKKDGEKMWLMYNDCGQFQMADAVKGSCDGFGINKKGVWSINGATDPEVKVTPVREGETPPPLKKVDDAKMKIALAKEFADIERETGTKTFMGNLDKDDDKAAARLMKKFNAKIVAGM